MKTEKIDLFDNISPIDFRYYGFDKEIKEKLKEFFSENARIKYQLKVEEALIKALIKEKICSKKVLIEFKKAAKKINAFKVYEKEKIVKHDIKALVNLLRENISEEFRQFIHLGLTSYDVVDTANVLRFKEATEKIILPELIELEKTLISLALREKSTLQIGRTHGQHAEPITFGFFIANYVDRLGSRIIEIKEKKNKLKGKISGAVGAYNASTLIVKNPEKLEKEILKELNLEAFDISTQIMQAEPLIDLMHSITSTFSVIANLADDLRHLQRTEIAEIFEGFEKKQVGSSTMPHKRNPITFENIKSLYKEFMPRIITCYLDQISEHQRDLTNSASQRFYQETFAALSIAVKKLNATLKKLKVDKQKMLENFNKSKNLIIAEPLYILLSLKGYKNAHEKIRMLSMKANESNLLLLELILADKELKKYIEKLTKKELELIFNPEKYIGLAEKKTKNVCLKWQKILKKVKK